jgi:sugar phosphate isomerase/epimerase
MISSSSDQGGVGGPRPEDLPLVLWAGCVAAHNVLARVEALQAGGFASMSVLSADLVVGEREGSLSLPRLAAELRAREAQVEVIDPYLGWYPGWEGDHGPHQDGLNVSEDAVLRYASTLEARSITVLTPFSGSPAPLTAVVDALGGFADRAADLGLRLHLEVIPTSMVPDLATGLEIVQQVDRANAGLVLDTFHLGRGGCDPASLDEIPLEKVFHLQLCDAARTPTIDDYFEEAVTHREFPGEGELPVGELTGRLVGRGLRHVGPEVFSARLDAMSPEDAGRLCAEKTRSFLASL